GTTALVIALHQLVNAGPDLPRARALAVSIDQHLGELLPLAQPARGRLRMLFAGQSGRTRALKAVASAAALLEDDAGMLLAQASVDLLRPPVSGVQAWTDFELSSPEYYNLLAEIAGLHPDRVSAEGHLPHEIADRVN